LVGLDCRRTAVWSGLAANIAVPLFVVNGYSNNRYTMYKLSEW
jgi:hypothetical protein